MRKALLLLALACPMWGQVCPDSVKLLSVSQGGFSLKFVWSNPTDAVTDMRLRLTDSATFAADAVYSYDPADTSNGISAHVVNLEAGTAYLVDFGLNAAGFSDYTDCQAAVAAIDCNGLTSNCDKTIDADGGGVGTDVILQITTPAGDNTPTDPTAPTHNNTFVEIDPATDLDDSATVTVSGGECTNLNALMESQQTAMDLAGSNLIYGVKIPAGQICRPEHETSPLDQYTCPTITDSTNKLLVYSEYPNINAHAPFGGSVDPGAGIGGIEMNLTQPLAKSLVDCGDQQNIRFQRVRIAQPDFRLLEYPLEPISSISAASPPVITLTNPVTAEQYVSSVVYGTAIVRAPGMKSRWFHGGNNPNALTTGINLWTHNIGAQTVAPYHTFTDAGSYTSGGIFHRRIAAEFTSATKASEPVLTFPADHGYDNGFQYTLTGISGGVATVASGTHNDSTNTFWRPVVLVSGSDDGMGGDCDGLYEVTAVTTTTWTLSGSPTGCTGGTLELVHAVMLHHLESLDYTQVSCIVSFESTTTAKVLYCTDGVNASFVPDWTAVVGTIAGWVSYDPPIMGDLIDVSDSTNLEFEQCIIGNSEMPWRTGSLFGAAGATDPIVQGSYISAHHWMLTNPVSLIATPDYGENSNNYERVWADGADGSGLQFLNNTVRTGAYVYQSESSVTNTTSPSDITFDAVRIEVPSYCDSEDTDSGGQICGFRHLFQWKSGARRISFNGLSFNGVYQDTVSAPWAIFFEIIFPTGETTGDRGIQDISITNSAGDGVGLVQLAGGGLGGSGTEATATHYARFKINNNFYRRIARPGNPQDQRRNNLTPLTGFIPNVALSESVSEVSWTNNTITYPEGGVNTAWNPIVDFGLFSASDASGESIIEFDKNLYGVAYSSVANYGKIRCGTASDISWGNCIERSFRLMGADDSPYANFGVNPIIAVLEAPNGAADLETANDACTDVQTAWDDSAGDNGYAVHFPVVSCSNAESGNARLDDVFAAGTWDPTGAYATYGADVTDILRAQGRILDVVHQTTSSTLVLAYEAPEINGGCRGSATTGTGNNPATATTVYYADDTPGSYSREITITGLPSGTVIPYRIACAGGTVVKGEVATQ